MLHVETAHFPEKRAKTENSANVTAKKEATALSVLRAQNGKAEAETGSLTAESGEIARRHPRTVARAASTGSVTRKRRKHPTIT